jgi:hypothetical protein
MMEELLSPGSVGAKWARYLIERWVDNLHRLKIGDTGELERSFRSFVEVNSDGDLQKIELVYAYYGLFVDMGVGKGTKSGEQGENSDARRLMGKQRGNQRAPKKWQNRTTHGQVLKLGEVLAENAGQRAGFILVKTLPQTIDLEL